MTERCSICDCKVHRTGDYAKPTVKGRSHATAHHYVAERFFGRSANRPGEQRKKLFEKCPWGLERQSAIYCYECHEEMIHNPIFSIEDIDILSQLVRKRGLNEEEKTEDRSKLAGRVKLLHEAISVGLKQLKETAQHL